MTPEQKAQVLELHGTGTTAAIAELVGVGKGAVAGLYWRHGLSKSSPHLQVPKDARQRRIDEKMERIRALLRRTGIPLARLTPTTCRYIVHGIKAEARFCGAHAAPDSSWCPEHHAICTKREEAA